MECRLRIPPAGINQPEDSTDPQVLATLADLGWLTFPKISQLAVGKARLLGLAEGLRITFRKACGFDLPCQSDESVRVGS